MPMAVSWFLKRIVQLFYAETKKNKMFNCSTPNMFGISLFLFLSNEILTTVEFFHYLSFYVFSKFIACDFL